MSGSASKLQLWAVVIVSTVATWLLFILAWNTLPRIYVVLGTVVLVVIGGFCLDAYISRRGSNGPHSH